MFPLSTIESRSFRLLCFQCCGYNSSLSWGGFFVEVFMGVLDRCIIDPSSFQGQVLFLISTHSVYCKGTLCDFSLQSKPAMESSEGWNPKFLLRKAAAPQPVSSFVNRWLHPHESSGNRWDLQRPHSRSWILLSFKSIGSSALENYCNEGKVMVITKVIWRTHSLLLMTWNWELLSKQRGVGLYGKNWKTPIIWIAMMRRSARS